MNHNLHLESKKEVKDQSDLPKEFQKLEIHFDTILTFKRKVPNLSNVILEKYDVLVGDPKQELPQEALTHILQYTEGEPLGITLSGKSDKQELLSFIEKAIEERGIDSIRIQFLK